MLQATYEPFHEPKLALVANPEICQLDINVWSRHIWSWFYNKSTDL